MLTRLWENCDNLKWCNCCRKLYSISSKIKNKTIIGSSNPISGCLSKIIENETLKRYLLSYVHGTLGWPRGRNNLNVH